VSLKRITQATLADSSLRTGFIVDGEAEEARTSF